MSTAFRATRTPCSCVAPAACALLIKAARESISAAVTGRRNAFFANAPITSRAQARSAPTSQESSRFLRAEVGASANSSSISWSAARSYISRCSGDMLSVLPMVSKPWFTSSSGKSSAGRRLVSSKSRTVLLYSTRLSRRSVSVPGSAGAGTCWSGGTSCPGGGSGLPGFHPAGGTLLPPPAPAPALPLAASAWFEELALTRHARREQECANDLSCLAHGGRPRVRDRCNSRALTVSLEHSVVPARQALAMTGPM